MTLMDSSNNPDFSDKQDLFIGHTGPIQKISLSHLLLPSVSGMFPFVPLIPFSSGGPEFPKTAAFQLSLWILLYLFPIVAKVQGPILCPFYPFLCWSLFCAKDAGFSSE